MYSEITTWPPAAASDLTSEPPASTNEREGEGDENGDGNGEEDGPYNPQLAPCRYRDATAFFHVLNLQLHLPTPYTTRVHTANK